VVNRWTTDLSTKAPANTAHAALPPEGGRTAVEDREPAAAFHPDSAV
jgi:hypothetical protein